MRLSQVRLVVQLFPIRLQAPFISDPAARPGTTPCSSPLGLGQQIKPGSIASFCPCALFGLLILATKFRD